MKFATLGMAATLALAGAGFAHAQGAVRLDDLDADRLNANQIIIEFEYDGGACETVGPAEVGAVTDGVLAVTFTAERTAEVCTEQVVEIEVEQAINVPADATSVAVTLIGPDGTELATGTDRIDRD